jgi:hypothetical protein
MAEPHTNKFDPLDLAWAAGVIEGEGCIRLSIFWKQLKMGRRPRTLLYVVVGMRDAAVVWRLHKIFGGHVCGSKTDLVSWVVTARAALVVLEAVRPFMVGAKCEQADVAIAFQRRRHNRHGWRGRPDEVISDELDTAKLLSAMKRKRSSVGTDLVTARRRFREAQRRDLATSAALSPLTGQ